MSKRVFCLIVVAVCIRAAAQSPVEYRQEQSGERKVSPLEVVAISETIAQLLKLPTDKIWEQELIGWSVKKMDGDRPPAILEDALIQFRAAHSGSNFWVTAMVQRVAARGRPHQDRWNEGQSGKVMKWSMISPQKPTVKAIVEFLKQSNFGNGECRPYVSPIHIVIFAPYKEVSHAASTELTATEKERRYSDTKKVIY